MGLAIMRARQRVVRIVPSRRVFLRQMLHVHRSSCVLGLLPCHVHTVRASRGAGVGSAVLSQNVSRVYPGDFDCTYVIPGHAC